MSPKQSIVSRDGGMEWLCRIVNGQANWGSSNVVQDRMLCGWLIRWGETAKEFSVAKRLASRSIYADKVLVKLSNFNHYSCAVPFVRVSSCLVLDPHWISHLQGREVSCMFTPFLMLQNMAMS